MALITPADVRVHFPHLVGTTGNDELGIIIAQADALLALYLGLPVPDSGMRTLEDVTYTLFPSAPHSSNERRMVLPVRPVVSVTSVHADLDELYTAATLIPSSEYVLDGPRGEIWLTPQRTRSWYTDCGRANRVVVVAGFSSTPGDVKAIAIAAVRHLWDRRRTAGTVTQAAAGVAQTYSDAEALLPQAVRDALGPYRLWGTDVG